MVLAVNQAFPDVKDYRNWPRCQQYLPHAQVCVDLIDTLGFVPYGSRGLLNWLPYYLEQRAQYVEAESVYQRAITNMEKTLGLEYPNPNLASGLNNLANLYSDQGKCAEAEPLYQRAIAIGEKTLGPEHPDLATWLNNLALLYQDQGNYAEAEPLLKRALAIRERKFGPTHPNTQRSRENYAGLLRDMNRPKG